jgi:hypothetical protein
MGIRQPAPDPGEQSEAVRSVVEKRDDLRREVDGAWGRVRDEREVTLDGASERAGRRLIAFKALRGCSVVFQSVGWRRHLPEHGEDLLLDLAPEELLDALAERDALVVPELRVGLGAAIGTAADLGRLVSLADRHHDRLAHGRR